MNLSLQTAIRAKGDRGSSMVSEACILTSEHQPRSPAPGSSSITIAPCRRQRLDTELCLGSPGPGVQTKAPSRRFCPAASMSQASRGVLQRCMVKTGWGRGCSQERVPSSHHQFLEDAQGGGRGWNPILHCQGLEGVFVAVAAVAKLWQGGPQCCLGIPERPVVWPCQWVCVEGLGCRAFLL